jgi:hypothetical protein
LRPLAVVLALVLVALDLVLVVHLELVRSVVDWRSSTTPQDTVRAASAPASATPPTVAAIHQLRS